LKARAEKRILRVCVVEIGEKKNMIRYERDDQFGNERCGQTSRTGAVQPVTTAVAHFVFPKRSFPIRISAKEDVS